MEQPQVLVSDFFGRTTFPHSLKTKILSVDEFQAEIIFNPETPIKKSTLVSLSTLSKNTRIFEVTQTEGVRLAKGEWKAYGIKPKWAKIEGTLVGYWDDKNLTVSKERLTNN